MTQNLLPYLKDKLNDQQFSAATHVDWNSLILAWAWSGKTRTLTYKIAYLVSWVWVPPERVLAVTFTNKAAWEMKERLTKIIEDISTEWQSDDWVGTSDFDDLLSWNDSHRSTKASLTEKDFPRIWTFHSVFLKILKIDIDHIWLWWKKNFVIYDSSDSVSLIKSIIKKKEMKEMVDHKDAKRTISEWKNKWYIPDQAWLHCESQAEERILEVYQEYRKQCQQSNALDFDDLLLLPKLLFKNSPEILQKWQDSFDHILVDEAQDTNTIQFELMKSMMRKWTQQTITFIGDDYQSIYRWRWAVMSNFLNLKKWRPDMVTYKLEVNYRSLPHIVEAGNAIIKKNKVQYEKNVVAHRNWEKHIRVFWFSDQRDEAIQIIDMITKLKEEADKSRSDFTLLYRTNAQSAPFEQVCITDRIPYKIIWGQKFFERREVKDILSYVKFILNPSDSLALKRIINTPARQIWKTTIEQLELKAWELDIWLPELISSVDDWIAWLKPAAQTKIKRFNEIMKSVTQQLTLFTPAQLLDQIIKSIQYENWLVKQEWRDKADERMLNLSQLINMASKFDMAWAESLSAFLEEVSLMTSIEEASVEDAEAIKMMTVHWSKGLEFPYVFIVWLEENVFPLP